MQKVTVVKTGHIVKSCTRDRSVRMEEMPIQLDWKGVGGRSGDFGSAATCRRRPQDWKESIS